ncbi:MAG: hypothetical protein K0R52_1591, partial [Alphaproteobacteria bacterium]|nr:hypothetical protein [Alphaproteobacteria bacterium]
MVSITSAGTWWRTFSAIKDPFTRTGKKDQSTMG